MADDVTIKYGSTGFEKIGGELKHLEKSGSDLPNWFRPAHRTLEEVGSKGYGAFRQLSSGISEAANSALGFIEHLMRLGTVVTGVTGILGSLGVFAAARWTEGMLKATESNRNLEASLFGIVRNQSTVESIFKFARTYAEQSPIATYHEVLETMRELAYQPAIKPIMEAGDIAGMERIMNIVQGLAQLRPEEGIGGAATALRQSLAGVWVTMQRQFGIRPEALAAQAGMSMEQMGYRPENALKALEAFVSQNVRQTTNLMSVMKKLRESYQDWLETIGNAGIYDKALGYLQKLNESFMKLSGGPAVSGAAKAISLLLESIADAINRILTTGIDWDRITDLEGAMAAFKRLAENTIDEFKNAWERNKDAIKLTIKEVLVAAADIGWDIGKDLTLSIMKGMKERAKEGLVDIGWVEKTPGYEKAPPYAGFRPWAPQPPGTIAGTTMAISPDIWNWFKPGNYPLAGQMGGMVPPLGAGQQLAITDLWAKMEGPLAEARGKERFAGPQTTGFLFATGQISEEEYFKRSEMDRFRGQYMKKLTEINEMPETPGATRAEIYQRMFGISAEQGEFGKAADYMTKAVDALRESFKTAEQREAERRQAEKEAVEASRNNTQAIKDWIQAIKEGKTATNIPEGERQAIREQARVATTRGLGQPQDEIRYDVERGYTNY